MRSSLRVIKTVGLICVGLVLVLYACHAGRRMIAVNDAKPYLTAAFTQPMADLDSLAQTSNADDWLRYGLALEAGRPQVTTVQDDDRQRLSALDGRLQAAKTAWLRNNPPGGEDEMPWKYQIDLSHEDATAVLHVQQATSADYWLSSAQGARTQHYSFTSEGTRFGGVSNHTYTWWAPSIHAELILTATACADAVRQAAGLKLVPAPEVVRRLRDDKTYDIGAWLLKQHAGPGDDYTVGPAACGSARTFHHYIELVKGAAP